MTSVLAAERLLTPAGEIRPGWVRVDGESIVATGDGPAPAGAERLPGILSPGFIDIHSHGGGGKSFEGGAAAAESVLEVHLAHGTTSMLASLVTDTPDRILDAVEALRPLVDSGRLLGVHLEGPWLSPQHAGAHDRGLLIAPEPDQISDLLRSGLIRMVTIAPELPGGFEAVRQISAAGVIAAIGHTDASYSQARRALGDGASVGTHLFNAMRGLHHREPGPVAALLEDPRAFIELIADGVHVHPAALRLAMTTAPERCLLVSDAMAAASAADGEYRLGPMAVRVREGVARLADTGGIAGSTLTLDRAVRFMVEEVGVSAAHALRSATAVPAAVLGRTDLGTLDKGARADLVVLDDTLHVVRVMRGGTWLP